MRDGRGPLLPGAQGQVYAQSATAIFRIELDTGRITRTPTPDLQEHVTFLAGRNWVLVKSRWSATGVLVRDAQPASPLPHQFDPEGYLHPGPGGRLWVEPESGTNPTASIVVRLAELDGRTVPGRTVTIPTAAAPYEIVADGYGELIVTNRGGIYRLGPSRSGQHSLTRLISRGDLVAAGGRRLLVWDCDARANCRMVLVDQQTGRGVAIPAAARTLLAEGGIGIDRTNYSDNLLSPDGTHLAVIAQDGTGRDRVHTINLRTGHDAVLPGIGTDANANRQLAWSADSRWLLALTDHRLRGYDTRSRAIRAVPLGQEQLLHVTAANAAGW